MDKSRQSTQRTLLIAEPARALESDLSEFLTRMQWEGLHVKTLKDTLLTLQSQRVDVLLLDASLLEEECDFISVIKGIEEDLPIIICADKNTPELESRIRQQGIFFYHIKSFGNQDLQMAITNAVNRSSH